MYSILNKSASSITESEVNAIRLGYSDNFKKPFSLIGLFYDNPVRVIMIVAAVLLVLILLILVDAQRRRVKVNKIHLAKEKEHNELLKDALESARRASTAKGSFMSRMSHEIRTPLNAVIGYNIIAKNELADAGSESERRQAEMKVLDCLTKSEIASKHLLSVINDVLDMSAIESGKIKISHERFDFRGLITSLKQCLFSKSKRC